LIGRPASDGCVRMRNVDVVEVFERLPENALVVIVH
jgi:lipoprotein-anchoring transpeptidase ErfK/SrfK